MYKGKWTEQDITNKELIEDMKEKGEIAYGLTDDNIPITLNNLIDFCKEQNIDFNKPVFLECPDGYFPLAYHHNGMAISPDGNEYELGVLVLSDGDW